MNSSTHSGSPRHDARRGTSSGGAARSAPVQRRSVERVQALLDAADSLLRERGYDAATLKAVGERAGIPTASVYHYFADRYQVEAALLRRYLEDIDHRVDAALTRSRPQTIREMTDAVLDTMYACYRESPSFVQLWFVGRTPRLSEDARTHDREQAEKLWHLAVDGNLVDPATPRLVLEVVVETCDRLFDMAFRRSPVGDDAVVDQARDLVTAYLGTYAMDV